MFNELAKNGITLAEDMGTFDDYTIFKRLYDSNKLNITRVRSAIGLCDWKRLADIVEKEPKNNWLFTGILKGFCKLFVVCVDSYMYL